MRWRSLSTQQRPRFWPSSRRRDVVADGYAHYKFVAFTEAATPLFAKAGLGEALDEGFCPLAAPADAAAFIEACGALRFWDRADGA